ENFRGMIRALDLDPDKLSEEANWLLNRHPDLSGIDMPLWHTRQLKRDPDWESARNSKLDINLLADGLQHASLFVAYNAACLFAACSDSPSRRELLRDVMLNGQGRAPQLITCWLALSGAKMPLVKFMADSANGYPLGAVTFTSS